MKTPRMHLRRFGPMPLTGRARRRVMWFNRVRYFAIRATLYLSPFFFAGIVFQICLELGVR